MEDVEWCRDGDAAHTLTSFIIIDNKGRLPANSLAKPGSKWGKSYLRAQGLKSLVPVAEKVLLGSSYYR